MRGAFQGVGPWSGAGVHGQQWKSPGLLVSLWFVACGIWPPGPDSPGDDLGVLSTATLRDRADSGRECADLSEALQILHLSGWISMCLPTETERESPCLRLATMKPLLPVIPSGVLCALTMAGWFPSHLGWFRIRCDMHYLTQALVWFVPQSLHSNVFGMSMSFGVGTGEEQVAS